MPRLRQLVEQPAVLDVLQGLGERLVPLGRVRDVRGVVVLARVRVLVGVGQLEGRVVGVVDLVVGIPGGPVVEVLLRLDVERRLLVPRGRAVAEPLHEVGERVPLRIDDVRAQLISHAVLLSAGTRRGRPDGADPPAAPTDADRWRVRAAAAGCLWWRGADRRPDRRSGDPPHCAGRNKGQFRSADPMPRADGTGSGRSPTGPAPDR